MSLRSFAVRLTAALAVPVAVLAVAAAPAAATGNGTYNLPLHQKTPIKAADFQQGDCPGIPSDQDGWHFVIPSEGVEFVELTVTFKPGGTKVVKDFGPPKDDHAYVGSPVGAELIEAKAVVNGEVKQGWFNLSHTCKGKGTTPTPSNSQGTKTPPPGNSGTPTPSNSQGTKTPPPTTTTATTPPNGSESPSASTSAPATDTAAPSSSAPATGGDGGDGGSLAQTGAIAVGGILAAAAALIGGGYLLRRRMGGNHAA